MRRAGIAVLIGVLTFAATAGTAEGPEIQTGDVERFYKIYDAAGGHPTVEQLQRDYLEAGTDGLHTLMKIRNLTAARIAEAIAKRPEMYTNAKCCTAVLPRVRQRVAVSLRELVRLYPQARIPPVTIVVGRGKPVGVGYPNTGLQIGLEALCAVDWFDPNLEDRFVHVIAHEYAHVQQVATSADQDKTELSAWVDNSTLEQPRDLGYWVGYRIAKSYYQHSPDKTQAFREILEMSDAKAFLARSGWYPGIQLQ